VLTLTVLCHRCGQAFPSEISVSERGIKGPFIEGVVYECPHCGTRDPYFTSEHLLSASGSLEGGSNPGSDRLRGAYSRLTALRRFAP
jgi:DNA-directed RNA polymerase subunit RPC12/RpoP